MELFQERGYDGTTVGDIAARAGLTERTFFRYFSDKREVLFSGSEALEQLLVEAIGAAPAGVAPLEVVTRALEATAPMFEERRALARKRQALIVAHAELRERELIKLAALGAAVARAVAARGVERARAGLVAELGSALFKSAFERWVSDGKKRDLVFHLRAALEQLREVAAEAEVDSR